jgi:hypothetical protein
MAQKKLRKIKYNISYIPASITERGARSFSSMVVLFLFLAFQA